MENATHTKENIT